MLAGSLVGNFDKLIIEPDFIECVGYKGICRLGGKIRSVLIADTLPIGGLIKN